LLFIFQTALDGFNKGSEMGKDRASHQNGDLLRDLDTCVASLPGLSTAADGFEERQQRRDAQRGSDDGEGASSCVTNVPVAI